MEKTYCEKCDKRVSTYVVEREIELPVKGEPVSVKAGVRICDRCGEECYDEQLENALFSAAYDVYRQRHNIVSPSELKAMRESYGLSQRGLGALLGWGEITVHRYENGSLPDEAHNQLLHLLMYPENMYRIAQMNGHRLHKAASHKLEAKLKALGISAKLPATLSTEQKIGIVPSKGAHSRAERNPTLTLPARKTRRHTAAATRARGRAGKES